MGVTLNRTVSLISAAVAGAAFVYFLIPNLSRNPTEKMSNEGQRESSQKRLPPVERNAAIEAKLRDSLAKAGIDANLISTGIFKLRGTQWQHTPFRPLMEFTLKHSNEPRVFWRQLEANLKQDNLKLVAPNETYKGLRPQFRAVTKHDEPVQVLRAMPNRPIVSILVDGVGHEPGLVDRLLQLDPDVVFSVDSKSPFSTEVTKLLEAQGREVVAHIDLLSLRHDQQSDLGPPLSMRLDELLRTVKTASGIDIRPTDREHQTSKVLNLLFRELGQRGYYLYNRALLDAEQAQRVAHHTSVRIASESHAVKATAPNLQTVFSSLDSALALEGKLHVSVQATPETLSFLRPWLQSLRQRGVAILRLSEIVK